MSTIHYLRHPAHMIAERPDAPFPATEQYAPPDDPLEHDVARMWGWLFGIAGAFVIGVAAWLLS